MNIIHRYFEEFQKNRSKIELDQQEVIAELERFRGNILLFGAGSSGIAFLYFLKRMGFVPSFFIDSDPAKVGTLCEGIPVISIEEIPDKTDGCFLVIVCINTDGIRYCKSFRDALRIGGHHAVYDRLHEAGCRNVIDYTFFRHCFTMFHDEKYNAPSCSDVELMLEHEDQIAKAYELLSDEESKEIYSKIVCFRLIDDTIRIPTLKQDMQYFEDGFYAPDRNAVFVDCGAYNGISLNTFLKVNGKEFRRYYGIEPDPENFRALVCFVDRLESNVREKISLYKNAAWSGEDMIDLYALAGPGSFVADIGDIRVQTIKLDDLPDAEQISFIKMNIEGSEKQALSGAKNTIKKNKPLLAIAGYHRTEDLWEIPLFMKECRDDYQISLRSYMNHISFVYYAK